MKTKLQKILALMLAIITITFSASMVLTDVLAATSGTSGTINWNLNTSTGVLTIGGTGYMNNYSSALATPWYSNRTYIKTLEVKEGIKAIGDYSFASCSNLSKAILPKSLVKLGASSFKSCTSLTGITIPYTCTEMYASAFYGCTALKWVELPSDSSASTYSHQIPDSMFYGCTSLNQVFVGSKFTGIYQKAFYNCSKLQSVIWSGNTFSTVGSNALYNATTNLKFVGPSSISSAVNLKGYLYQSPTGSCSDDLSYTFDLSKRTLTFEGTGSITSSPWNRVSYFIKDIDLSNVSGSICDGAFTNCLNANENLILSSKITSIGSEAFLNTNYSYVESSANTISVDTNAFSTDKEILFLAKKNNSLSDYVTSNRTSSDNWKVYCLNKNHTYTSKTTGTKCTYCDRTYDESNVSSLGDHEYVYEAKSGNDLYYKCSHCGVSDYTESINNLILDFEKAISTNGNAFTQNNYDGRFDINYDGYVNAKDYKILISMKHSQDTGYEMTLSNKNATSQANALYQYICSVNGNGLITGQQESTWMGSENYEFEYIQTATGKMPALRGFDFMGDDFNGCVRRAKAWAAQGGIVTICWHCSKSFDQSYDASKTKDDSGNAITANMFSDSDWEKVLTTGTSENKKFLQAMDKAGNALLQLQAEGIPVIWRPFHEFDGGWFWWGCSSTGTDNDADHFKRLWQMMYDHFTNDLGLNNLIWMLGYCHNSSDYGTVLSDWYPGNNYCDIIGADTYEVESNGGESRLYYPVKEICGGTKPVAMHETGKIPTIEQYQDVPWCYFMTWHTEWLTTKNTTDELNAIYNSEYAITLDELPNFYN